MKNLTQKFGIDKNPVKNSASASKNSARAEFPRYYGILERLRLKYAVGQNSIMTILIST
jgi:hypothetical protein